MTEALDGRQMRLRYAGICRGCNSPVAAGQRAVYFRQDRHIECLLCASGEALAASSMGDEGDGPAGSAPEIDVGTAGGSARREYERRAAKREQRIRAAHPKLGGLILALSTEPQSTRAWERGARGEELLARRLDALRGQGVVALHDRRIPGTRANIDHIVVGAAGVFVIDAKRYKGRPVLKIEGGLLRPRVEKLLVGGRDCTKLVVGLTRQVRVVRDALAAVAEYGQVPVNGMLCFVEADWPLIGGSFSTDGVRVLWPAKAAGHITASGSLDANTVNELHRHLATAFPAA